MEKRDVLDILKSFYDDLGWDKIKLGNWDMTSEPIPLPKSDKDEVIPVVAPE